MKLEKVFGVVGKNHTKQDFTYRPMCWILLQLQEQIELLRMQKLLSENQLYESFSYYPPSYGA